MPNKKLRTNRTKLMLEVRRLETENTRLREELRYYEYQAGLAKREAKILLGPGIIQDKRKEAIELDKKFQSAIATPGEKEL